MRGREPGASSGDDEDPVTSAERRDAERRVAYRIKRRRIRAGQVLMAVGVAVAIVHWLAHLGVFAEQPSSLADILAGYPTAAVFVLVGAIMAGQ